MKTRFGLLYVTLFFLSQILGLVFGFMGFKAPLDYLRLGSATGLHYFSFALLIMSGVMFWHIQRSSLHTALHALPAYHLLGLLGMQIYTNELAGRLNMDHGIVPRAAEVAAVQHPNLLVVILIHSAFGLIGGLYLLWLTKQDDRLLN
jgi:hypothetical protein